MPVATSSERCFAEIVSYSAMLYPSALEAYQQDKDCWFGDITLSLQGVSYSGKMLPWNEVKSFGIGLGRSEYSIGKGHEGVQPDP